MVIISAQIMKFYSTSTQLHTKWLMNNRLWSSVLYNCDYYGLLLLSDKSNILCEMLNIQKHFKLSYKLSSTPGKMYTHIFFVNSNKYTHTNTRSLCVRSQKKKKPDDPGQLLLARMSNMKTH